MAIAAKQCHTCDVIRKGDGLAPTQHQQVVLCRDLARGGLQVT